jgi:hypothetical protein
MSEIKQRAEESSVKLLNFINILEKNKLPYCQFRFEPHPLVQQIIEVSDRLKNEEIKQELLESAALILLMKTVIRNKY